MFGMRLCNWNLKYYLVDRDELFDGSNCDLKRCFMCTYASTSSPSFTLLSSSPSSSSSYTPTYRNITLFPTKVSSSSYVPTLSPTRQITQSPCPDSVVLNDNNANDKLTDNSVNKEVIRCFDTSKVTNMERLFKDTGINADLSSWDVSSVTNMAVSYQSSQYLL